MVACVLIGVAAADAQPLQYGMNTRVLTPAMAAKMNELGARVVRLPFGWDLIEPSCKGCFDWRTTDAWRDEAKRAGLTIFASLTYAPRWANGNNPFTYPPLVYQDWYDFVYAAVSRYKDDIVYWGVWNEPNLDVWLHGASLEVYANLALTARAAIVAANAGARVVGPEVSHHAMADGWFAAAMRATGALFDIISVHWYPDAAKLDRWLDTVVGPIVGGKPVWLSETGMRPCQSMFGEVGQALFYRQVLEAVYARRHWVTSVMFYDLYDPPEETATCGSAVTRHDWSNRPAFLEMQSFIRAHR